MKKKMARIETRLQRLERQNRIYRNVFILAGLALAAMVGLTGCTSYPPADLRQDGWKRQSTARMRASIPETYYDVGENWMAFYDASGSVKFKSLTDSFHDSGEWEITSGGKLCVTWKKIRAGRKTCYAVWARTIWKEDDAFWVVSKRHIRRLITDDNQLGAEYTWKSGNPGNLRPDAVPSKDRGTGASFPSLAPSRQQPSGTATLGSRAIVLAARLPRAKPLRKGEYQSVCQIRGTRPPLFRRLLSFQLCATPPEFGVMERRGQLAN